MAAAGAVHGFAERTGVGVVIDRHRDVEHLSEPGNQRKIRPSRHVRRKRDALMSEIDRASESDSAAFEFPRADDFADGGEQRFRTAVSIGGPGFTGRDGTVFKERRGELGASNVDRQHRHYGLPLENSMATNSSWQR